MRNDALSRGLLAVRGLSLLLAAWIAVDAFSMLWEELQVFRATGGRSPNDLPMHALVPLLGASSVIVGLLRAGPVFVWIGYSALLVVSGFGFLGQAGRFLITTLILGLLLLVDQIKWK